MLISLVDESATLDFGKRIAQLCPDNQFTLHLKGDLGAGKTTFSRGFIQALGHTGNVKSPTYTLVENYQLNNRPVFHFDLYRLADPEELDYLGLDDYLTSNAVCLIEWPEQADKYLPEPDLKLEFNYQNTGRTINLTAFSNDGQNLIKKLNY